MISKKVKVLSIILALTTLNAWGAYEIVTCCSPLPSDASFIGISIGFTSYVFGRVMIA